MPGAKISHKPESIRLRIGWRRPSQALKSPTTETRRACGAQTAKCTPGDAVQRHRMGAEPFVKCLMRALEQQMVVQRAKHRPEAEGVVEFPMPAGVGRGNR